MGKRYLKTREELRQNYADGIINKDFGRLKAIKISDKKAKHLLVDCICSCGNTRTVCGSSLVTGKTRSCGCLQKESTRNRTIRPKGVSSFNRLYRSYRYSASKAERLFDLSVDQFKALVSSNCYYCGNLPSKIVCDKNPDGSLKSNGWFNYNGIDRVDNAKGYTLDNVVTCCTVCNKMKHVLGQDEFLAHVTLIVTHQNR